MRSRNRFGPRLAAMVLAVFMAAAACGSSGATGEAGPNAAADSPGLTTADVSPEVADSGPETDPVEPCPGTGVVEDLDVEYAKMPGVDPNLLSLDVYEPVRSDDCGPAPVMIYVHGGGWRQGDKANRIDDKVNWFTGKGWVFASVNYRLSPVDEPADVADLDPDRVVYPVHNEDVAAAVAWVYDNAADYDADPDNMVLMGHSAGAAIVASVATDERYLEAGGLGLDALRCAVPLDSAAYDVRWRMENGANPDLYVNAFGTDPAVWDDASPVNHVEPGKNLPDFLFVVRGLSGRPALAESFAGQLRAADAEAEVLVAEGLDHEGVNAAVGALGDTVVTPALDEFLQGCIDRS